MVEWIGCVYVEVIGVKKLVVGYDICLFSLVLVVVLIKGVMVVGCDVFDIGLSGIE